MRGNSLSSNNEYVSCGHAKIYNKSILKNKIKCIIKKREFE